MSGTNVNPPQTYSRLFRPWDTHKGQSEVRPNTVVKIECNSMREVAIKPEINSSRNNSNHNSDSDREECALSSSSHSSYDDSFHSSDMSHPAGSPTTSFMPDHCTPLATAEAFRAASHHYSAFEHQHRLHLTTTAAVASNIPSPEDIYYAAAQTAAASGLPLAATPAFGMDPFTLSLMEQEYARVMAEDAHLKALNARKQRPKKFKCPHCDVAFSNNGQLKGHIRIHTGERPFKCDEATCGKTFTRNEELTRHKRIHTGLRPYPCTACGKKFGRRDHLKKHMKTHMPQDRQLGPAIFVPMYPYLYGY